jgi:plastocyanin
MFLWSMLAASFAAEPPGSIVGQVAMPASARRQTWAWIDDANGPLPDTPARVPMAQRGLSFDPGVLVIPLHTIVDFPNFGPEQHNVYWIAPAGSADLGTYRINETKEHQFHAVGLYPIGCKRHPSMSAIIRVVPNSWVVQVQPQGTFELTGVPAGIWHVIVWSPHENATIERDIVVHAGRASPFNGNLE